MVTTFLNEEKKLNNDLRLKIAEMVFVSGEGHIPSSFSIVDIINYLYKDYMDVNETSFDNIERDYFILSKGHGCGALWAVLNKYGFLSDLDIDQYSTNLGRIAGHPDCMKVPAVEASTGSLGHGMPFAVGIALGLKISEKKSRVIALVGDGECHEGTIWESANIAANRNLSNLTVIVDWNKSAQQLMPYEQLGARWKSFGWHVQEIIGHDDHLLSVALKEAELELKPSVIISENIKGKGVPFIEGHGIWHHRIPSKDEMKLIRECLSDGIA
jgi:transketolase